MHNQLVSGIDDILCVVTNDLPSRAEFISRVPVRSDRSGYRASRSGRRARLAARPWACRYASASLDPAWVQDAEIILVIFATDSDSEFVFSVRQMP